MKIVFTTITKTVDTYNIIIPIEIPNYKTK